MISEADLEKIVVPTIGNLNSEEHDYVARLDEGLKTIKGSTELLCNCLRRIQTKKIEEALSLLKETGIDAKYADLGLFIAVTENSEFVNKEQLRSLEDKFETFKGKMIAELEPLFEKKKQLTRSMEDYAEKTLALTQFTQLTKFNINYQLYLLLVRPKGVYVCDEIGNDNTPHADKNESLDPKKFDDESYLQTFKEESKKAKTNAYLVQNPSSELPNEVILRYSLDRIADDIFTTLLKTRSKERDEVLDEIRKRIPKHPENN